MCRISQIGKFLSVSLDDVSVTGAALLCSVCCLCLSVYAIMLLELLAIANKRYELLSVALPQPSTKQDSCLLTYYYSEALCTTLLPIHMPLTHVVTCRRIYMPHTHVYVGGCGWECWCVGWLVNWATELLSVGWEVGVGSGRKVSIIECQSSNTTSVRVLSEQSYRLIIYLYVCGGVAAPAPQAPGHRRQGRGCPISHHPSFSLTLAFRFSLPTPLLNVYFLYFLLLLLLPKRPKSNYYY